MASVPNSARPSTLGVADREITYKVKHGAESHIFKSSALHFDLVVMQCARRLQLDARHVSFLFRDSDGDLIKVSDDAALTHAVKASGETVKLTMVLSNDAQAYPSRKKSSSMTSGVMMAATLAAAVGAFAVLNPKRTT
jgi:hypothetical protein